MKKIILILFLGIAPEISFSENGGGWGSSGGEIIQDRTNPWWVKNTSEVRWCADVDSTSISLTVDRIEWLIGHAIEFWKREFGQTIKYGRGNIDAQFHRLGVATQNFIKQKCDGTEDLKFLFGYRTLSKDQSDYLVDPTRFVAVSVRTAYDIEYLRARGFVYVSSDMGPYAYRGAKIVGGKYIWQHEFTLLGVLQHELGHIFGIPHVGSSFELMSQLFPEYLATLWESDLRSTVQAFEQMRFFVPAERFSLCGSTVENGAVAQSGWWKNLAKAMGFPPNFDCIHFKADISNHQFNVFLSNLNSSQKVLWAVIDGGSFQVDNTPMILTFFLPDKQKVFQKEELPIFGDHAIGAFSFTAKYMGGRMKLPSGSEIPLFLQFSPISLTLFMLSGAKIQEVMKAPADESGW